MNNSCKTKYSFLALKLNSGNFGLKQARSKYSAYKSAGALDAKEASGITLARTLAAGAGISSGINVAGAAMLGFANNYNINTGAADSSKALSTALLGTNWNNTSTTGLMNLWNSTLFAPHVTWRLLRGSKGLGALGVLGSMESGAAAGGAAGPWGMLAGAVVGLGTGLAGWFSGKKKAKRLANSVNALADAANLRTINNMRLNALNILTGMIDLYNRNWVALGGDLGSPYIFGPAEYDIINNLLRIAEKKLGLNTGAGLSNIQALGGTLLSNGSNFTTGLSHIDAGSTHEQNPYEGVPMGTDNLGVPNFVEEGETIYKDYVFSNRLTVPMLPKKKSNKKAKGGSLKDDMSYEEKVLKPYLGLTFSEAAKKIEKAIYGEGGNLNGKLKIQYTNQLDKQDTLDALLAVLAETQERLKQEEQAKQLQEMIANMSPEELLALLQLLAVAQLLEMLQQLAIEQQAAQEQLMALLGASPEEIAAMEQLLAMELLLQPLPQEQPLMSPEEAAALEQQLIAMLLQPIEGYACGGKLHADGGNLEGNYFSGGGKFITINDNRYEITPEGKLINVDTKSPIYKNENDWPIYYNLIYGRLLQDENGHYFLNDNKDALAEVKGLSDMSIPGIELKKLWDKDEEVLKYLWSLPLEDIDNLLTYGYPVNSKYGDIINTKDENAEDESIEGVKGESARAKIKELRDIIRNLYASDLDKIKKELKELKNVESRARKRVNALYRSKGLNHPENLKGYSREAYEADILAVMQNPELVEKGKDINQTLNVNKYAGRNKKITLGDFTTQANSDGITNKYKDATEYFVDNNGNIRANWEAPLSEYLTTNRIASGITYDPNSKSFISDNTPVSYSDLKNINNLVKFDESPFESQDDLTSYYRDKLLLRYKDLNKGGLDFDWESEGLLDRTKPFYLNSSELQDFINGLNSSSDAKDKALATMLQNSSIDGKESPIYMEMLGLSLGLSRANNESDENYFNRIKEEDTKRFNPPANRNSDSYWGQDHPPFLINNGRMYRMRIPNGDNSFEDIWLPNNLEGFDYNNAKKSNDLASFIGKDFANVDIYDVDPQNLNMNIERVSTPNGYRYFAVNDDRLGTLKKLDPKTEGLPTWESPKGYNTNINFYEASQEDLNAWKPEEDKLKIQSKYPTLGPDIMGGLAALTGGISALLPPDYSRANAMLTRGYFTPRIVPERIPDPARPKFIDPFNLMNLVALLTATTLGNIKNSGVNQGSKNAALIAAGHLGLVNQGNALIAGILANNALEKDWYTLFLGTRHANQSAQLEADRANLQAFRAGDLMIALGYGLAELIDLNRAKAASAGLLNILNNAYRNRADRLASDLLAWYLMNSSVPMPYTYRDNNGKA